MELDEMGLIFKDICINIYVFMLRKMTESREKYQIGLYLL